MFTGLVQHRGVVQAAQERAEGSRRLVVSTGGWQYEPEIGASVAVDGCCLTVVERDGDRLTFDLVVQTVEMTTLGLIGPEAVVNLEHAATLATLLGGHIVQGHVDGTGEVLGVSGGSGDVRVRFGFPRRHASLLMPQGSVTVAGVSLTVADLGDDWFEVALIPQTCKETTLGCIAVGDRVNLEFDCMARMVQRQLEVATGQRGA